MRCVRPIEKLVIRPLRSSAQRLPLVLFVFVNGSLRSQFWPESRCFLIRPSGDRTSACGRDHAHHLSGYHHSTVSASHHRSGGRAANDAGHRHQPIHLASSATISPHQADLTNRCSGDPSRRNAKLEGNGSFKASVPGSAWDGTVPETLPLLVGAAKVRDSYSFRKRRRSVKRGRASWAVSVPGRAWDGEQEASLTLPPRTFAKFKQRKNRCNKFLTLSG